MVKTDGDSEGDQMNTLETDIAGLSDEAKRALASKLGLLNERTILLAYYTTKSVDSTHQADNYIEVTPQKIKDYISEYLPAHALPTHIMRMDKMPTLANGKLDTASLPIPTINNKSDAYTIHGPTENHYKSTKYEKQENVVDDNPRLDDASLHLLISTLEELLGFDGIRKEDNFFELGGDSITAIRFVSKAREAGVSINVADVANAKTLAALALCDSSNKNTHEVSTSTEKSIKMDPCGDSALTPTQRWFMTQNHPQPSNWNIGIQYELLHSHNSEHLKDALLDVLTAQPTLFTQFVEQDDGNTNCHYPHSKQQRAEQLIQSIQTVPHSNDAYTDLVSQCADQFDLKSGRLIGAAIEVDDRKQATRLNLVFHHLIADYLSIQILIQQIDRRLQRQEQHMDIEDTLSMRAWATMCERFERDNSRVWTTPANSQRLSTATQQTEKTTRRIEIRLSKGITTSIIDLCKQSSISVSDALVFALANTWQTLYSETTLPLDIKSHGRDLLDSTSDTSNSIGWFSSYYPADLALTEQRQPITAVRLQKTSELLRQAKEENKQYLLFANSSETTHENVSTGRILLNYLGQFTSTYSNDTFRATTPDITERLRSPNNYRAHNLEINAYIDQDELIAQWAMPEACMNKEELDEITQTWRDSLTAISSVQLAYPDVDMDQHELDEFLDSLE